MVILEVAKHRAETARPRIWVIQLLLAEEQAQQVPTSPEPVFCMQLIFTQRAPSV